MNTAITNFSNFELLIFGSIAGVLFVVLFVLKKLLPFLIKRQSIQSLLKQYMPLIELFIWVLFILITIQQFSDSNHYYSIGLFVLLMLGGVWVLWFSVRDFIAGALFKANNDFKENDIIQIANFEGKIMELGSRMLKIESDHGEVIFMPYSKVSEHTIIKVHPGEMVLSHSFTIRTNKEEKIEFQLEKIKFDVLSLPWSSIKKSPKIEIIHEDEDGYIFEVKLYSLEKQYFFKMEQAIRKKFEMNERASLKGFS
ncbi:MAG: mechanosensitive ion channel [Bacteroidales bacterium]|nr:mechanosensitive ion channel [Bacteroidales bacterium]